MNARTVAILTTLVSLTTLSTGVAGAHIDRSEAEPVKLFAFDIDPECQALECTPEEGAFYPGRAERKGSRFTGEPLQVPQGTDVEFVNVSSEHHNIDSFEQKFGRPIFGSDEHVTQGMTSMLGTQFLKPGTYAYFCGHHPETMFGLIEITK